MKVKVNGIYRHFKGDYYLVINTCYNAEDESEWVIYQGLYDNAKLWIRSLEDFTSKVDKNKYPNCNQEYKFQLQSIKSKRDDFNGCN